MARSTTSRPATPQSYTDKTFGFGSGERRSGGPSAPADDALLFPSPATGKTIADRRGVLDRVAVRAGFGRGEVRMKAFRHSYASARRPWLDGGDPPISLFTVSRELDHGSETVRRERYAHPS